MEVNSVDNMSFYHVYTYKSLDFPDDMTKFFLYKITKSPNIPKRPWEFFVNFQFTKNSHEFSVNVCQLARFMEEYLITFHPNRYIILLKVI